MSGPENPHDNTIWDPETGEHAIEDRMHGPSAVFGLLQTPPMPRGDGTYYQAGGYYALGSNILDAKDQPLLVIGAARSTTSVMREMQDLEEWRLANLEGEGAATALEARRQRDRLEKNKVARAFKPSDVCAGASRLENCETASPMITEAEAYAANIPPEGNGGKGRVWNTLAWLGKTCASCALHCEVAVETQDGKPTGITRFSNTRPLADDVPVIKINLGRLPGGEF
ncbi:MAG TPA: hypothetical protein VLG11_01355 [Candidatus Saccharimonadales bacterium]|nr:hypothetical protein [Candidatus Saccharimonadales bacterium]